MNEEINNCQLGNLILLFVVLQFGSVCHHVSRSWYPYVGSSCPGYLGSWKEDRNNGAPGSSPGQASPEEQGWQVFVLLVQPHRGGEPVSSEGNP